MIPEQSFTQITVESADGPVKITTTQGLLDVIEGLNHELNTVLSKNIELETQLSNTLSLLMQTQRDAIREYDRGLRDGLGTGEWDV